MKELFIFDKDREKKIFFKGKLSIGRSSTCNVQINDNDVSSSHAVIVVDVKGVFIQDFNSFNGTYLNGQKLEPKMKYPLQVKDIIQIGGHYFFFNSLEGNIEYLDLPSFTGSISMVTNEMNDIIHDKFEPIVNKEKEGSYSLKGLRLNKEKINGIKNRIKEFEQLNVDRAIVQDQIENKKIEIEEFNSYFKMKNYKNEEDIFKTISSVNIVNQKIKDEMRVVQSKIKKLAEEMVLLKNQMLTLENQMQMSESECRSNDDVISELSADLEIFKGRGGLEDELAELHKKLKKYESLNIAGQIKDLKEYLTKEEQALKEAQKQYAQKKFGSDGLFKKNNNSKKAS